MSSQTKFVGDWALSLMLVVRLAAPIAAASPASVSAGVPTGNVRIDNFGQVDATYYRGAQPQEQDLADLKALGVRLVIDLAEEGDRSEASRVEGTGMKFVRIPLSTGVAPPAASVDQFLALVTDPANQPVYVHCIGGRHRTGALTAVYRMREDGWSADQAFLEMKQYRFGADFLHPELKAFVYSYLSKARIPPPSIAAATTRLN